MKEPVGIQRNTKSLITSILTLDLEEVSKQAIKNSRNFQKFELTVNETFFKDCTNNSLEVKSMDQQGRYRKIISDKASTINNDDKNKNILDSIISNENNANIDKDTKELIELNIIREKPSEEEIQMTDNNSVKEEEQRDLQIKQDVHAILTSFSFWYYVAFGTTQAAAHSFILYNIKSISSNYYDEKFIVTYLGIATFVGFASRIISSYYLNYLGLRFTNI